MFELSKINMVVITERNYSMDPDEFRERIHLIFFVIESSLNIQESYYIGNEPHTGACGT